jgi:hypothetical protein
MKHFGPFEELEERERIAFRTADHPIVASANCESSAVKKLLHSWCKAINLQQALGRKLFVSVGRLAFFRRNVIVFMRVGGKGGRGGVHKRLMAVHRLWAPRYLWFGGGH